jgi:hypothetical protein
MNASAFLVINNVTFNAAVGIGGVGAPVCVGSGESVSIPITGTGVPEGTPVYPSVMGFGGVINGTTCYFQSGAPSATYTITATELGWGVSGPS